MTIEEEMPEVREIKRNFQGFFLGDLTLKERVKAQKLDPMVML